MSSLSISPGKRTDLEKVIDLIAEGKPDYEIVPELTKHPECSSPGVCSQKLIVPRDANTKPTVFWFWGDTGTGKSRTVKEETMVTTTTVITLTGS